jgi:two-component system, chemotaxis family, CheB/CheR fusion protein
VNQVDPHLEALLQYLNETRGFDFTGYKRTSLARRVDRRTAQVGVTDYAEYLDYLQVHPEEFTALFNTILINVTGFFRDPEMWEFLRTDILPAMPAARDPQAHLRVWSAGCASGEEAYSLAMLVAEVFGADALRERVKIYATDVDEEALAHARQASFTAQQISAVPPEYLEKYFEPVNGRFAFRKDLRRTVIFGRNDLVQDAPISRIDLMVCRNTLMYFNAEAQRRILSRFHFALADHGLLFLGKAEMLLSHAALFVPVDLKLRMFRKVQQELATNGSYLADPPEPQPRTGLAGLDGLRSEAFMGSPVAQVVLTADGTVALANRHAESTFGVSSKDIGRPFRDLDLSYRPVELRGYIEQAQLERRTIGVPEVEHTRSHGETFYLDIQINPLVDTDSRLLGVALVFQDITPARGLRDELERANRHLETAYEELQSTNEELETTNEELQSTVEELETTNEELQSTNEELETMNEELRSTNDELQNINEELRDRTAQLDEANLFLKAILTSLDAGVAVINLEMNVLVWNRRMEDLWGLRSAEAVGRHFLALDIGLPTDDLRPIIRKALSGAAEPLRVELSALNRRGRTVLVGVTCAPLQRDGDVTTGAILFMEAE